MANTLTGKIKYIFPTETFPSKTGGNPFQKRNLLLDCSRFDQNNGQRYENYPQLEFVGKNADLLNGFSLGEVVTVSVDIQGRIYEKDGKKRVFTSVIGYKIERVGGQPANQGAPKNDDLPF